MARRTHRSSFLEDLLDIAAALPWWVGVALAVGAYVGLNALARMDVQVPSQPGVAAGIRASAASHPTAVLEMVPRQFLKTASLFGQYLIPIPLLAGAGVSAWRRAKRHGLLQRTDAQADLRQLSWREFEMLVGEVFRRRGYRVAETPTGPDGGVDLVLTRSGERFLVQCKHWRAQKVGVTVVRELYGVMAATGAIGGAVVTSGTYTEEAMAFAAGREIELIAGEQLAALARAVKGQARPESVATVFASAARTAGVTASPATQEAKHAGGSPLCPRCRSPMVHRAAKRGASAGVSFWGCSQFPKCRGTRSLEASTGPALG